MQRYFGTLILLFLGITGSSFVIQDHPKNYYGIPENLTFDKVEFKLSGSYHPNEHYYKQEYIPSGESPNHFNKMLIIDFYVTDEPNQKLALLKEKELDDRKKSDPVVNYEQFENTALSEYLLDFILSDANGDKISVVEHNIYHYANYTDKTGHKGVLLVGTCSRGYGDNIKTFITSVKDNKIDNINKLSAYPLPQIQLN